MKNHLLFAALLLAAPLAARAQVGIGITAPSAQLEVRASNKDVLFPQVSLTRLTDATTIPSPALALLVFNTNASVGGLGFYYSASATAGQASWMQLNTGGGLALPYSGAAGTSRHSSFTSTPIAASYEE